MMNWIFSSLILFSSLLVQVTPNSYGISDHQFHISKTQIAYSETDNALQVSMHVFIDDLEEALRRRGKDKLFINTEKETIEADSSIVEYLSDVFSISIGDKALPFTFIGKESSDDLQAIWCYLEFEKVGTFDQLTIENGLLMEVYDDQKNMILFEKPGSDSAYFMFTTDNRKDNVKF